MSELVRNLCIVMTIVALRKRFLCGRGRFALDDAPKALDGTVAGRRILHRSYAELARAFDNLGHIGNSNGSYYEDNILSLISIWIS